MKNLITRRIIILMSMAITATSVLIFVLGLHLLGVEVDGFESTKDFIYATVIVMVFVIFISYIALQQIVKPVKNIVSVALSMVEGDFSIRADETLKGEIGFVGKTMNMLSVELYKNISQLYIEKNRLKQVLDNLQEGMIAIDINKKITHYNKPFLEMFDLEEEDIDGKNLGEWMLQDENINKELLKQETIISKDELIKSGILEMEDVLNHKISLVKTSKYLDKVLRIIIKPIQNEREEVAGAIVLIADITEGEKLEVMRREYVANVSHELRSPLTSIRGLIEPLMDDIVTEEEDVKRYYSIIHKESMRLSRLIDDIMELSRLQTNKEVINKTRVNLHSIIEMIHERYSVYNEQIQLNYVKTDIPDVFSNYDRIEQLLVILLDNAYKFTPVGGEISIILKQIGNKVNISIQDNGVGIDEEDLPFIFDRFYKCDRSRTHKGTGLGLSIAREISSLMGEKIFVESNTGKGSCFTITLEVLE